MQDSSFSISLSKILENELETPSQSNESEQPKSPWDDIIDETETAKTAKDEKSGLKIHLKPGFIRLSCCRAVVHKQKLE